MLVNAPPTFTVSKKPWSISNAENVTTDVSYYSPFVSTFKNFVSAGMQGIGIVGNESIRSKIRNNRRSRYKLGMGVDPNYFNEPTIPESQGSNPPSSGNIYHPVAIQSSDGSTLTQSQDTFGNVNWNLIGLTPGAIPPTPNLPNPNISLPLVPVNLANLTSNLSNSTTNSSSQPISSNSNAINATAQTINPQPDQTTVLSPSAGLTTTTSGSTTPTSTSSITDFLSADSLGFGFPNWIYGGVLIGGFLLLKGNGTSNIRGRH